MGQKKTILKMSKFDNFIECQSNQYLLTNTTLFQRQKKNETVLYPQYFSDRQTHTHKYTKPCMYTCHALMMIENSLFPCYILISILKAIIELGVNASLHSYGIIYSHRTKHTHTHTHNVKQPPSNTVLNNNVYKYKYSYIHITVAAVRQSNTKSFKMNLQRFAVLRLAESRFAPDGTIRRLTRSVE